MRLVKLIRTFNTCSLKCTILHPAGNTSRRQLLLWPRSVATMTTRKHSIPHETRTAAEPRQNKLYTVRLARIEQINPSVRLLRLALPQEPPLDETVVRYLPHPDAVPCTDHGSSTINHRKHSPSSLDNG